MLGNNDDRWNIGKNDQEQEQDIFAEPDVEIPEELGQTESNTQKEQQKPEGEQAAQAESTSYRYTRDQIKQEDTEQSHQTEYQRQAEQYSYIPKDKGQEYHTQSTKPVKPKKTIKRPYAKAIGCAVLCGVIIGGCIIGSFAIGKNVVRSSVPVSTTDAKLNTSSNKNKGTATDSASAEGMYTVSQIAENCGSSVVAITNKGVAEVQTFFGVYQQETEGSGSGVIVSQTDTELLIVTNYHVIEGYNELSVCFNDSEDAVYRAQVKGTDESNDLAVIAIPLSEIDEEVLNAASIATLGSSDDLQVGDNVVAIGNALGLGRSVTYGIISALDRQVTIDNTTYTLLQTDAAINPGNSGGAMFNMYGELVGINSAKFASAQIEGMGFAIPMAKAQPIIENLMTKETKTKLQNNYGCLNISGNNVSTEASQLYGIPEGVYVGEVLKGGAADRAGIQEGDIIVSVEGTAVTSIEELKSQLQYYKAGETVELTVYKRVDNGYEEQTVTAELDDASKQDSSAFGNNGNNGSIFR